MNPTLKSALAALLATAALTVTGCSSAEPSFPPAAAPDQSASPTAEPTPDAESVVSPALVAQGEDGGGGFVTEYKEDTATVLINGEGRWTVNAERGTAIDGTTGLDLGEKANTFLREHYFRRDRWMGKWTIKEGEMDAYREKVTPSLFTEVDDALAGVQNSYDEHGPDASEWPKKVLTKAKKDSVAGAYLFMNTNTNDDGKGDFVYRITKRSIFRASAKNGWASEFVGSPVTYVYFDAAHKTGSTGPEKIVLYMGWEKVKGEWRIARVGRDFDQ